MAADKEAALQTLDQAFGGVEHDLWDRQGRPNVSPVHLDDLARLKAKGLHDLDNDDLDLLMWRVGTTMGSENTLKYILPRFVRAVVRDPGFGWTAEGHVQMGNLARANFGAWPRRQRKAVADAMVLVAHTFLEGSEDEWTGPNEDARALLAWAEDQHLQAA